MDELRVRSRGNRAYPNAPDDRLCDLRKRPGARGREAVEDT